MKTIRVVMAIVVGALASFAAGQDAPKLPAIQVSAPGQTLDVHSGNNVCAVDFRNLTMYGETAGKVARLRNGNYLHKSPANYEETTLMRSYCFGGGNGTPQRALVMTDWLDCEGGKCSSKGIVQVFGVQDGHPVITQQLVFGSHAWGPDPTFDEKALSLTITGRSDDGSPDCCPKYFDVVTYEWQGDKFVQQSYKRVAATTKR